MTRTVFDDIIEYSFEDDKKYLKMCCTFNITSSELFRHKKDMIQPTKFRFTSYYLFIILIWKGLNMDSYFHVNTW